jgi:hypothetical protein
LCSPLLGPFDQNRLSCPIEVFKAQSPDFAASQSINRKQHQDRVITHITRVVSAGTCHEPLHIDPTRTFRDTFLFEEPWRVDGRGDTGGTPSPHLRMSKE